MTLDHPYLKIRYQDTMLIAEWDNRKIPKSCLTTAFLAIFWVIWTPVTIWMTSLTIAGKGSIIWLIFGYAGVILIPMTWILRHTIERIEIDNNQYRHYFVNFPSWFPKQWNTDEITQIDFGHFDEESITTLNVWRGRKRDMIAYWGTSGFKELLFEKIQTHLEEIGSDVPVINTFADTSETEPYNEA